MLMGTRFSLSLPPPHMSLLGSQMWHLVALLSSCIGIVLLCQVEKVEEEVVLQSGASTLKWIVHVPCLVFNEIDSKLYTNFEFCEKKTNKQINK